MIDTKRGFELLVVAALLAGVLLRVAGLSNDPVHPSWIGWPQDEGRWAESARMWALFGSDGDASFVGSLHLLLAPLWQAVLAALFSIVGVGVSIARVPSALAGCGILVGLALGLRTHVRPSALLLCVALAAFDPALIYFSRVGIPEMLALFWYLLAFIAILRRPVHVRGAVLAGLFVLLALGTKATTAPAAAGLLAAISLVPGVPSRLRRQRALAFTGVVATPIVAAIIATLAVGERSWVGQLMSFVGLPEWTAMLSTLYRSGRGLSAGDPSAVNLLLAGSWTAGVALWPRLTGGSPTPSERAFGLAALWASGPFFAWVFLDYFPDRWMVHLHLPLVIALAAGFSSLIETGAEGSSTTSARHGLGRRTLLLVPLGVLVASWAVLLLGSSGLDVDRIRWHLPLAALASVAAAAFAGQSRVAVNASRLAGAALAALLGWRLWAGIYPLDAFWTTDARQLVGVGIGALAAGTLLYTTRPKSPFSRHLLGRSLGAYGGGLALLWLIFTAFDRPESSRALQEAGLALARYSGETIVAVDGATSVMLESPLRYQEARAGVALPDVVVVMVGGGWGRPTRPLDDFEVVFEVDLPHLDRGTAEPAQLRIYERRVSRPTSGD